LQPEETEVALRSNFNTPPKQLSIILKNVGLSREWDFPVSGTFPDPIIYVSCFAIIRTDADHHSATA